MPEAVTVSELLRQANVHTTDPPPVKEVKETPKAGMFTAKNGQNYWSYPQVTGETIVLPKPIEKMTEQDFYDLPIQLYDNQPGRLPQNLVVVFKDPQWAGYWGNKSAKEGIRISDLKSRGFVPATKDDVEFCQVGLEDNDGAVEQGDVVLMKIHKAKMFMLYKQALDKAKLMGGTEGYKNRANEGLNPANRSKNPYYLTPQATQEFQGVGPVQDFPTVGE